MLGVSALLQILIFDANNSANFTSSGAFGPAVVFAVTGGALFALGFIPERHRIIGFLSS
jgi:hypothetical protein